MDIYIYFGLLYPQEAPVDLKPLIYDAKEALRHGEEICLRPNLIVMFYFHFIVYKLKQLKHC